MRERILANPPAIDRATTMDKLVDLFIEIKKRKVADTTYSSYLYRGKYIKDYFDGIRVIDIRTTDIEAFFDSLFSEKNMQKRSVKDVKTLLSSILEYAVKQGVIANNPVHDAEFNSELINNCPQSRNNEDNFFTYEEAVKFLELAKDHELYELFYLTLYFGLRREEVLGLRWSCIDFERKTMEINHTVTIGTKINRINQTKTSASKRTYDLSDDVITLLKALREKEDTNRTTLKGNYNDNDYLFKHEDGTLYHPQYPSKTFKKLLKRSNGVLPTHVTLHGLRASCVSMLVHDGYDFKYIQKWVGQTDLNTTLKIYTRVKDSDVKKELADHMSKVLPSKYTTQNK